MTIDDQTRVTTDAIHRFNDAFQRHDPSVFAKLVAESCVIENTTPAPNGARYEGRDACVGLWSSIATAPGTSFDLEEEWASGERAIIRWRFRFGDGEHDSVRGVNLMRVRDGLIVEAMGYVKGT